MDRRTLLQQAVFSIALGALGTPPTLPPLIEQQASPSWGYDPKNGPDHWSELSEEYEICTLGRHQSPINLHAAEQNAAAALRFDYHDSPVKLVNNGRTLRADYAPGSTLTYNQQTFDLVQFHFHDPSEHRVDGTAYAMELHLVHKSQTSPQLAVVGVFLQPGRSHPELAKVWTALSQGKRLNPSLLKPVINASRLLPVDQTKVYTYQGSLTTPPCDEVVSWILFQQPIQVSDEQIQQFVSLIGENARPVRS